MSEGDLPPSSTTTPHITSTPNPQIMYQLPILRAQEIRNVGFKLLELLKIKTPIKFQLVNLTLFPWDIMWLNIQNILRKTFMF